MASSGAAANATSAPAQEPINRSTKDLPPPNPDTQAQPCKGRRFLVGKDGKLVKNSGGDCVVESAWCTRKPCRATHHCKEPVCMREGRRLDNHHLDCKVLCKANLAAKCRKDRIVGQTLFHVDHGRRWIFCTINANGRDCPRAWLVTVETDLKNNARCGRHHLCREVGKGKEQEHCHWCVEADIADTEKSHALHRNHVKDLLHAVNVRIQSKPTRTGTEQSLEGLLIYLSKDLGKRAFDFKSNFVTSQDVIDNNKKHKEQNPEAWADGKQVVQPTDILAWCKTSAKINGTGNLGGFGNELLWGVWERSVTFHSKFHTASSGTALDPARAAIQWKIMCEPDNVDELDVATVLFGATHVRSVTSDQCEGESFYPNSQVFRRGLNTLKRKQALDRSTGGALEVNVKRIKASTVTFCRGATRQQRITLAMIKDWQLKSWQEHLSRAPMRHHRHIRWHHEDEGNVGKSFYLAFLAMNASACLLGSDDVRDCLYALAQWMDAHDGATPHIIAFDLTRSDAAAAPYKLLEMLSNGFACSLKYQSRVMVLAKCHLVCVSNFPPADDAPMSADRWTCNGKSTIINLRDNTQGFNVSTHAGAAPTNTPSTTAPADAALEFSNARGSLSPLLYA